MAEEVHLTLRPETKATVLLGGMLRRCYDDVMIYTIFHRRV